MSYGRAPYYIYEMDDGFIHFLNGAKDQQPLNVKVPIDALAQFVASMVAKGRLGWWLQHGKEVHASAEVALLIDNWISDYAEVDRRDYCCYLPNTAELVKEIAKILATHKEVVWF